VFRQLIAGLTAENVLNLWLILFLGTGLVVGVLTGFFKARKIQPNGFKWKIFRFEAMIAVVSVAFSGVLLSYLHKYLTAHNLITFNEAPGAWWVIALEYAASFFLFDTYFYWLHRWMHKEPVYSWVHKLHHKSTAPNLLTTLSVNPLESFVNGGFTPLFLTICTVIALPIHKETVALMGATTAIMGLYVHAGYELLPRWWNKSWATKWFITTTFHDQHHKYFNYNFGGYTTMWDYFCGTTRKKYEADFDKNCARRSAPRQAAVSTPEGAVEA
jgi:sterol desaturase/sphingolipid hydroxylase (fatty acid hydroxylase superfamily)